MKKFNFILSLIFATQTAFATVISDDKIELGKPGSSANKSLQFLGGRNATKPQIRYNVSGGTLEFSHNGSDFADIGSGSGGGSGGINLLKNGDFETAIGSTWTNSGGTFARVTSGTNLLFGKGSGTFTPSATAQYIQTALVTIPEGLGGQNCMAKISYKGGDATYLLKVLDSSAVLLGSKALPAAASLKQDTTLNFPCPAAAGQIRLRLESTAAAPIIAVDNAHLGEASNLFQFGQATYLGSLNYQPNALCRWQLSSIGSFTDFPVDSDCLTPTATGSLAMNNAGKVPGFKILNAQAGTYRIIAMGSFRHTVSSGNWPLFRFTDGTNFTTPQGVGINGATAVTSPVIEGSFTYATNQGDVNIKLQAGVTSSTQDAEIYAESGAQLEFQVFFYPTGALQGYIPDSPINWNAELALNGSNYTLPLATNPASVPPIASVTAVSKGTIPAMVACAGIAPTGLTCAGGTEHLGIAVNVPVAGKVEVCADFTVSQQPGAGSGSVYNSFRISKTALDYSETELEASASIQSISHTGISSVELRETPAHICGSFNAIAGLNIFQVKNQVVASGTVFNRNDLQLASSVGSGTNSGRITVRPLTQNQPAPVLIYQDVSAKYGDPSTAVTTSAQHIVFATSFYDTNSAFSGGIYTAPKAGKYHFSVNLVSATNLGTNQWELFVKKNNSVLYGYDVRAGTGSPNTYNTLQSSGEIDLAAGETLDILSVTNTGSMSLLSGSFFNIYLVK